MTAPTPHARATPVYAVFDFDGTLTTAPWPRHSGPDEPANGAVLALAHALADAGVTLIILSGRSERSRHVVTHWLDTHDLHPQAVILRQASQPDDGPHVVAQYKVTHLRQLQQDGQVLFFSDDQPDARTAAAELGIPTLNPTAPSLRGA